MNKKKIANLVILILFSDSLIAEETSNKLEDVLITENIISERKNNSSTKIIISKEEIEKYNDQSMGDILKRLPGLTFTGPAGYVEDIRFRGADKGYTQFLIDGEAIASGKKDRQFQVSRLSADMIERIEIIKQASAEFDSDGVAGTINIILKKAPEKNQGSYSISYGVSNSEPIKEATFNYGGRVGKLNYILSVDTLERPMQKLKNKVESELNDTSTNDRKKTTIETEEEERVNTEYSIIPKISYEIDDNQKISFNGYYINGNEEKNKNKISKKDEGGTIGVFGDHTKDKYVDTLETEDKDRINYRILGKYEYKPNSNAKYAFTVMSNKGEEEKYKTTNEKTTIVSTNALTTKESTEHEEIDERENKVKADASFILQNENLIKVGFEYSKKEYSSNKSKNGVITTVPSENVEITEDGLKLYALDEISLDNHLITPGIRIEKFTQNSIYNTEKNEGDYTFFNPSLHYLWQINDSWNYRASFAKKVKKPKFDQIYTGIKDGTGTSSDPYITGNLNLKPEVSYGYEMGLEYFLSNNKGVFGINTYYRDIQDKIQNETSLDTNSFYYTKPKNVGKANMYGLELDGNIKLDEISQGLSIYGNLSFFEGKYTENGKEKDLKDIPEYAFNIGFDKRIDAYGLTFGAAYNKLGKMKGYEDEKEKIEKERTMIDIYALKKINNMLNLRLSGKNITEVQKHKLETTYYDSGRPKKIKTEIEESEYSIILTLEGRF